MSTTPKTAFDSTQHVPLSSESHAAIKAVKELAQQGKLFHDGYKVAETAEVKEATQTLIDSLSTDWRSMWASRVRRGSEVERC
ncbi:MAG: hypothetical protein NVS9B15_20680 [Acidobacteriaceae bacterium]